MNARCLTAFCLCMLLANACAAPVDEYAYAWPLQTSGDSAAWQVELTPEIYAAVSTVDLRDVEVVNAANDTVPLAAYRAQGGNVSHEALVGLPMFALPQSAGSGASGDEAIRLRIERGADGKLRRLDADVGSTAGASITPAPTAREDLILDASTLHA